jgi:hypothetical protein
VWLWEHLAGVMLWSWMGWWTSKGLSLLIPGRPVPAEDRRWRWRVRFWRSRLGAWWFGLASTGIGARETAPTLHRPTELMLGLQIEDLWRALPEEARRGLDDLPATAAALRLRVDELRRGLAHLERAGGEAVEVERVRTRLTERRDAALHALERLRVLALRLSGAVSVEGEFTQQLRAARELELELLQDLGAHPGVGKLTRRRGGTPTPSPTPA